MNRTGKRNFWTDVVTNAILAFLIIGIVVIGFYGSVSHAFSKDDSEPIYKGNSENKNVTLMINVYWGTEYISPMLEILKKHNVKTTFFVGGYWVAQNASVLNAIVADGHEIGNHGYYHKDQDKLSYQQNVNEIETNHKLVREVSSVEMKLFAPPSGAFSSNTLAAAKALGYRTIMWSRDTIDWRDKNTELIFTRATKNISNGELILMHPTQHTLSALDRILKFYAENGFNVVTVSENIA